MSVEKFPGPKQKPELQQSPAEKMREMHMKVLSSEGPVHGSGFEALSDQERATVDSLLTSLGSSLEDPVLQNAPAETFRDLIDYASMKPNAPGRAELAQGIQQSVQQAQNEYYNPEYKQAA